MDALAASGVRFDRSFVTHTKCTPSRSSLLTGQYPHVGGHRTLDQPVRPHEVNMVAALKRAGFRTALVGKNHCVDEQTLPDTFDFHDRGGGGDGSLEPVPEADFPVGSFYVGLHPGTLDRVGDHNSTTMALDWMQARLDEDADSRLFVWLNWDAPHPPYRAPKPFFQQTDRAAVPNPISQAPPWSAPIHERLTEAYGVGDMTDDDWRELRACYDDMCSFADGEIGRVLDRLEDLGIADETLVIVWSDHGDFAGDFHLPEKWDTVFTDSLVRVPTLMQIPGVEPVTVGDFIESIDLLPTALDYAGVELPGGMQGVSYRDVIEGHRPGPRDVVLCQGGQERAMVEKTLPVEAKPRPCEAYCMKQAALVADPTINLRAKMLRGDRFKYVFRVDGSEELYDLERDPQELTNFVDDPEYAEALTAQRARLLRKLVEAESVDPPQDYLDV